MQSKYDKETVIGDLLKKGLKPTFDPTGSRILEMKIPKDLQIGIKAWAKIDFLRGCGISIWRMKK